jgi:aminoglycoside N3'-acetyltransferase
MQDGDRPVQRPVGQASVGDAPSRLLALRDAVDFAVGWLSENRPRAAR